MITQYYVCQANGTTELERKVYEAIKKGWQPLGGVAVRSQINCLDTFYQVVVVMGTDER